MELTFRQQNMQHLDLNNLSLYHGDRIARNETYKNLQFMLYDHVYGRLCLHSLDIEDFSEKIRRTNKLEDSLYFQISSEIIMSRAAENR